MKQIKELCIFDLDETLIRVPGYTDKKAVESFAKITFTHPYEYYDHPLSLNEELHNIQLISPVYDAWKNSNSNPESESILITHRVIELESTVIDLLKSRGITFNSTHFLGRASAKSDVIEYLITFEYDPFSIVKIKIFEDSIDQIFKYQQYFNNLSYNIDVEYWIVDKSRMFRIYDIALTNKTRIELI